jgi:hypothetical protein
MTGRATGANARPAIIRIASNRRMATLGFTILRSHRLVAMERTLLLALWDFRPVDIDRNQTFDHDRVSGFGEHKLPDYLPAGDLPRGWGEPAQRGLRAFLPPLRMRSR